MITRSHAETLARLLESSRGVSASLGETEILGVRVLYAVVQHDEQLGGRWKTLHVIGIHGNEVISLGVIPEEHP